MSNENIKSEAQKAKSGRAAAKKVEAVAEEKATPIVAKEIDPNQIIIVRSGFHGRLVYKSPRTREKFVWGEFGADQEMELRELRNAKSANKKYFENNWLMFDEEYEWVIGYLGLIQYYKNALPIDKFDGLFSKTPAEIEKTISRLSNGQKKTVSYRAMQLIAEGEIDSNKAIAALERALGVELIER